MISAYRKQSSFIHQVFKIRAGEARGSFRNRVEVNVIAELFIPGMDFQDSLSAPDIGQVCGGLLYQLNAVQPGSQSRLASKRRETIS